MNRQAVLPTGHEPPRAKQSAVRVVVAAAVGSRPWRQCASCRPPTLRAEVVRRVGAILKLAELRRPVHRPCLTATGTLPLIAMHTYILYDVFVQKLNKPILASNTSDS